MTGRPPSIRPGDTWPGSRLRAVRDTGRRDNGQVVWLCLCDPALGGCGGEVEVRAGSLRTGRTLSCGCLHSETARRTGRRATNHAQRAEVLRLVAAGLSHAAIGRQLGIHPSRVGQILRAEGVPPQERGR